MFKSIITHRGIDIPLFELTSGLHGESSWESFYNQIDAGFGLEFDIQMMRDGTFAISHDSNLDRVVAGGNRVVLSDITTDELATIKLANGKRMCNLDELLTLLVKKGKAVSALHLKHISQDSDTVKRLISSLVPYINHLGDNLIIFDAKPQVADCLKKRFPQINLAASVAHAYDIDRYAKYTGDTLLSPEEVIQYRSLYSWVWLDEWDLIGPDNSSKCLVNQENVEYFRAYDFKVAAVSPELHATSPALLGNESHEVGNSIERLKQCWREWSKLNIDALCTDHGSYIVNALKNNLL